MTTESKIDQILSALADSEIKREQAERRSDESLEQTNQLIVAMQEQVNALKTDREEKDDILSVVPADKHDEIAEPSEAGDSDVADAMTVLDRRVQSRYSPSKPALFNGEVSESRARNWRAHKVQMRIYLNELESAGEALSEARKVNLFIQSLGAPAILLGATIQSRSARGPSAMLTLVKFITALDKVYLKKMSSNLFDQMFKMEQIVGESTEAYYERFTCLQAEMLESNDVAKDIAVNWFINGLIDVLKEKVTYRRHADSVLDCFADDQPEEAVERCFEIAAAEEAMLIASSRAFLLKRKASPTSTSSSFRAGASISEGSSYRSAAPNQAWRQATAGPLPARQAHAVNDPSPLIQRRHGLSKDQVKTHWDAQTCFNCSKAGHFAKNCRSRRPAALNVFDVLDDGDDDDDRDEVNQNNKLSKK